MTSTARTLVLFGATGDLARRMVFPALFSLHAEALLPDGFSIIGVARRDMDDNDFRQLIGDAIVTYSAHGSQHADSLSQFLRQLHYHAADLSDGVGLRGMSNTIAKAVQQPVALLLSVAPSLVVSIVSGLYRAGLAGKDVRIAVEKPLGLDLISSETINNALRDAFPELNTFRIDHYLGKETVQNLMALRFGNSLFEPLWNSRTIDHVQITVAETVGAEGRADYYNSAGALRDMVQNHILQLLALLAMEPPTHFDAASIRDEKVKVLRSLRPIDHRTIATDSVIGQYGAGVLAGAPMPGYIEELGCASDTETFVALKAKIDNWRWKGVPFYLRTGKRLAVRQTEIVIQFKPVPHSIFAERGGELHANKLRIRLQPEEDVRLLLMAKVPGLDRGGVQLRELPLNLSLSNAFASARRRVAYERLLLDFVEGDPTLFVRRDEVVAQWEWIDKIRNAWAQAEIRPSPYAAGSWGPQSAIALTERNGVRWHD